MISIFAGLKTKICGYLKMRCQSDDREFRLSQRLDLDL